jgi:glycine hydroxymethyltransferase
MEVRKMVEDHHSWFNDSLIMISSENLISPLAREMQICDFTDRYAEGMPGHRYYQGLTYIDDVERKCMDLAKRVYKCNYADARPISATCANTGLLFALTKPGDIVMVCDVADGAHISSATFGAVGVRGLKPIFFPFDRENMNIDIDAAIKVIKHTNPKLCLLGMSVFLFPLPLKELKGAMEEVGATLWYDGAHVMGLIAGGQFQDPLREGADVLSGSTHKTLPGPQHGLILWDKKDDKFRKKIRSAIFPGVVSNHHLHKVAALCVTLAETLDFGETFAKQIVKNSQKLGEAMHERGFDVFCSHLGFTKSHTILVNVSKQGGGKDVVERMEKANIITNKNLLPGEPPKKSQNPDGMRLGVSELTRLGMKESEMVEVAEFIKRIAIDKEDPGKVAKDVKELKKNFNTIKYCYHEHDAYKHYKIVK